VVGQLLLALGGGADPVLAKLLLALQKRDGLVVADLVATVEVDRLYLALFARSQINGIHV